jgi:hypothetical protein
MRVFEAGEESVPEQGCRLLSRSRLKTLRNGVQPKNPVEHPLNRH